MKKITHSTSSELRQNKTKALKIGVLTEIINYHSGARAPLMIAKHLALLGHTITIYAYDVLLDQSTFKDLKQKGIQLVLLKRNKTPLLGKFFSGFPLYKLIKTNPSDVMWYSGTLPFFLAAYATRIPIIRMYQGTQFDALLENKLPKENLSLKEKLLNKIANLYIYTNDFIAFRLCKSIVAISKFAANEGETLYKRKVDSIIYHGTSFLPDIKKSLKKKNGITIISISRLTPYKGFHLILESVKNITTPKITTVIAGSQPKNRYLQYLKRLGGKNLKLIIDPSDYELALLYKSADFCVTADRYLYFGLSIFEAAFYNLPTVVYNFAAASEVVDHGKTGFVANTHDELTKYVQKLAKNPRLIKKLGIHARKKALLFTWDTCAKEWEKAIYKTINK